MKNRTQGTFKNI